MATAISECIKFCQDDQTQSQAQQQHTPLVEVVVQQPQ